MQPTLVYIYGPPASGKLTIAARVAELSGFPLFDNHLTVDAIRPVFEFGSEPFIEVLHRLRLDVFETAARAGTSLVFTNNSAWSGLGARERFASFAAEAERLVGAAGGRTVFARLTAPLPVLQERVGADSRKARGKLVDADRLRELVTELDPSPLHAADLCIDTSLVSPAVAAAMIMDAVLA